MADGYWISLSRIFITYLLSRELMLVNACLNSIPGASCKHTCEKIVEVTNIQSLRMFLDALYVCLDHRHPKLTVSHPKLICQCLSRNMKDTFLSLCLRGVRLNPCLDYTIYLNNYRNFSPIMVCTLVILSILLSAAYQDFIQIYFSWLFFFFYGGSLMDVASQTAWRNSPLLSACLPASTVETPTHSPMSCVNLFLGLPLPLLPSHVPSKNSFSNVLCRLMWPKYDNFRFLIIGSKAVGLLSLAVQGHWHLFFSQSMKFWVSSGSISSRKKLFFSRRSLRWSKPRDHRLLTIILQNITTMETHILWPPPPPPPHRKIPPWHFIFVSAVLGYSLQHEHYIKSESCLTWYSPWSSKTIWGPCWVFLTSTLPGWGSQWTTPWTKIISLYSFPNCSVTLHSKKRRKKEIQQTS